jgi:hypothetical protein
MMFLGPPCVPGVRHATPGFCGPPADRRIAPSAVAQCGGCVVEGPSREIRPPDSGGRRPDAPEGAGNFVPGRPGRMDGYPLMHGYGDLQLFTPGPGCAGRCVCWQIVQRDAKPRAPLRLFFAPLRFPPSLLSERNPVGRFSIS